MAETKRDLPSTEAVREVRSFTELIKVSIDKIIDEETGRPVDHTRMLAWNATHGVYRYAGSQEEVQEQLNRIMNAKSMAASALIVQLALDVLRLEPEEVTLTEVIDRAEKRAIDMVAGNEDEDS